MAKQNIEKESKSVSEEKTEQVENPQATVAETGPEASQSMQAEKELSQDEKKPGTDSDDELFKMGQALEKAQADLADAKEQVLRAYADAQNIKRRSQMDVEKAHKYALENFVEALLPVVDSLERGLGTESSNESADAMKEGMELTLKLFIDTLKRFNVEQISPEGEPFDPAHHQAMSQMENPEVEPGSVISVFQKGYTLNGRLVRPAMVVVSK